MGFRCFNYDTKAEECIDDKWKECKSTRKGRSRDRCNFNDLMIVMGKAPPGSEWIPGGTGPAQDTTTPDIDGTAKNIWDSYQKRGKPIPNFQPYKAIRGGTEDFIKYIRELENVVIKTASKKTATSAHLWDEFNTVLDKIQEARIGDHGRHVISAAQTKLPALDPRIVIMRKDLGYNPISVPLTKWQVIDWEVTAARSGVDNFETLKDEFEEDYYNSETAKDHRVVIRAYEEMKDHLSAC